MTGIAPWFKGPAFRAFVLIVLVSWNIRTLLAVVGAASSQIEAELGDGGAVTGTVSTVFVVLAALGAALAIPLTRRTNAWLVTGISLLVLLASQVLLAFGGSSVIWLAIGVGGFGAGVIASLTPAIVAALVPGRVGVGVGVYMAATAAGFFLGSVLVPWSTNAGHTWNAVAWWLVVLGGVSLAVWLLAPMARKLRHTAVTAPDAVTTADALAPGIPEELPGKRLFSGIPRWVVVVIVYLAVQSMSIFALFAWLAPSFQSTGAALSAGAAALGLLSAFQVVSGLAMPVMAQRGFEPGRLALWSGVLVAVGSGIFWLLVVEGGSVSWSWIAVILIALGHGGAFAMANYIVAHLADTTDDAVRYGSLMMFVAQLAGAAGPLVLGAVRDASGGYSVPWAMLTVVGLFMVAAAVWLIAALRDHHGSSTAIASSQSG